MENAKDSKGSLRSRLEQLTAQERETLLSRLSRSDRAQAPPGDIPARDPQAPLFLSPNQERLWLLSQLQPENPALNLYVNYRLRGDLPLEKLERALALLLERHEALRTTIRIRSDGPEQVVHPAIETPLVVEDCCPNGETEPLAWAQSRLRKLAQLPFDLQKGPLVRFHLLELGAEDHLLHVGLHHIVSDEWSIGILLQDLSRFFSGQKLEPLPIQYADFAAWQRGFFDSHAAQSQKAYWASVLEGPFSALDLPADYPRPLQQQFAGARQRQEIRAELAEGLRSFAFQEKATPFIVLLAVFSLLLGKYSQKRRFIVGAPTAGRTHPEVERLVGFFLNTLPLRVDLTGDPSFRQLVGRLRRTTLEAFSNQEVGLEALAASLGDRRGPGVPSLFQAMLVFQPPISELTLAGLEVEHFQVDAGVSLYDLSLYAADSEDRFELAWEYSTGLFEAGTVARYGRHLEHLLRQVLADPELRLSQVSLLTEAESQEQEAWNRTEFSYPAGSLVEWFEAQVEKGSERPAFYESGEQVTFGDLRRRAAGVAAGLAAAGVGPGDVVGVLAERSAETVAGLLGVLGSGAAFLPLDPSYPEERLAYMATDAEVKVILESRRQSRQRQSRQRQSRHRQSRHLQSRHLQSREGLSPLESAPLWGGRRLVLEALPSSEGPLALAAVSAESPAYLIYTSGSTGRPKGVVVPHRQILNRLQWMWQAYPFEPGEVGCQRTALNFVDSLWEMFGYLLAGVPAVVVPDQVVRDPQAFIEILGEYGVSRLWLVPSLLGVMLEWGGLNSGLGSHLPELKHWVLSGEAFDRELYRRFEEQMPEAVAYNLYGTSEVWDSTWYEPEGGLEGRERVPIGRPIPNTTAYILDENWNPVPVGVAGELVVGGVGLAHGYLKRAGLTAEQFIPDMFTGQGGRLYRTGDLAKWLPDGQIAFLGRRDHQVKIRGHRVELGELETVLLEHPAVQAAVSVLRDEQLAAYIVKTEDTHLDSDGLREWLRARLPDFMIPASFTFLESLPLTPNGKIDRQGLPDPDRSGSLSEYEAPRDQVERTLAGLWAEALNLERVGVHQHFFHLGGNSLLAARLLAQVRSVFGVPIPLHLIFSAPTVSDFAKQLQSILSQGTGHEDQPGLDQKIKMLGL